MVPDVPLVKGDVDPLFGVLLSLNVVQSSHDAPDKLFGLHPFGKKVFKIPVAVPVVLVHGDVVHVVEGDRKRRRLPFAEGIHPVGGGAAQYGLNGRVGPFHELGGLVGEPAVGFRFLVPHLPVPVHLVAETPELDAVGLVRAVFPAQVAPVSAARMVAVFQQVPCFLRAAGTEVYRHHGRRVGSGAPLHEFVRAEGVRLRGPPCKLQAPRAVPDGPDPILPVVSGDEVAAGVPYQRDLQVFDQFDHVCPESVFVRFRVSGLKNAAVNGASEMLDERAEDPFVDLSGPVGGTEREFCVFFIHKRSSDQLYIKSCNT